MAKRPRRKRKAAGPSSPVPLIIFIVLFVFTFAVLCFMWNENRALNLMIYGKASSTAFDTYPVEFTEDPADTEGYLYMLEQKDRKFIEKSQQYNSLFNFAGVSNVEDYKQQLQEQQNRLRIVDSLGVDYTLSDYIKALELRIISMQQQIENFKEAVDDANERKEIVLDEKETAVREKVSTIDDLNEEMAEVRQRHVEEVNWRQTEIIDLRDKLANLDAESSLEANKLKDNIQQLEKTKVELEATIAKLVDRKKDEYDPQTTPVDGKVLSVNLDAKTLMLDIGKQDGARIGLRFDVFQVGVGGMREKKGEVEVRKVYDDVSYAGIVEMLDEYNPILADNIVVSPIFQRGKAMIFAIEPTDFDQLDIDVIRTRLKAFGNELVTEPSIDVRYCIVGDKVNENNDRPVANGCDRLGIPAIRASNLMRVLGED